MDFYNSESPGSFFTSLLRELKFLALSNIEYFKDGKHSHHAKFHAAFCLMLEYLDRGIEPCFREISQRAHEFDASQTEKGNGYRSLLRIVQKCCLHLLQISRYISNNREGMLFRRTFYMKELEAYVATLGQLRACLYYAMKLMTHCQSGCLFADEDNLDNDISEHLMTEVEMLSQDCFYGRCLGFQFCESMQRPLQVVAIAMASFSEGYQENSQIMKVATSLFNSGKYFINPEIRAQQVVNITRTADIQFCKAFWSITESEIMHQLPTMVGPSVQVDEVFHLGPDAFDMPSANGGEDVTITPPCAHTGPAPVQVRLLSYRLRDGQEQHLKSSRSPSSRTPLNSSPRSPGLLIHCHGGGFVAQSSRSHEVYLRQWAKDLDVPILSIDYSLAPENPFPRALEECFYAYAWAVLNCHKLGSTGEVICLAGDSAGGNLIITTAMRAASFNIRRPDGILAVYTPVLVRYTPSPARLLCLMDPLLPAGILSRCLAAYAGVSDELSSQLAASVTCHIESSAATLRFSSQEAQEAEWIVVTQDASAKTNTTLKSLEQQAPQQHMLPHGNKESSCHSDDDSDCDEEEIFSRPRIVASVLSSVVDAKDKLMNYMDSYTHLFTNSFASGWQSSEEIPLIPVNEDSKEKRSNMDSLTDSDGNASEESPGTQSFYTPLMSPGDLLSVSASESSPPQKGKTLWHPDIKGFDSDVDRISSSGPEASTNDGKKMSYSPDQPEAVSVPAEYLHLSYVPFRDLGVDESSENTLESTSSHISEEQNSQTSNPKGDTSSQGDDSLSTQQEDFASCSNISVHNSNSNQSLIPNHIPVSSTLDLSASPVLDSKAVELQISMPSLSDPVIQHLLESSGISDSSSSILPEIQFSNAVQDFAIADKVASVPSEFCKLEMKNFKNAFERKNITCISESDMSLLTNGGTQATAEISNDYGDTKEISDHLSVCEVIDENHILANSLTARTHLEDSTYLARNPENVSSNVVSRSKSEMLSVSNSTSSATRMAPNRSSLHSALRTNLKLDLQSTTSSTSMSRSASTSRLADLKKFNSSIMSISPSDFKRERHLAQSPLRAIRNIPIVKNPYMSPLLAPDWLLEGLPHICMVACHLDPLLDDSIMFTKRLRSLGKSVDLLLLDDLPHGFLNFSLASNDARHGSDLCVGKLRQLLQLGKSQTK